jgi:predicted small secreted protein
MASSFRKTFRSLTSILALTGCAALLLVTAGCNTVEGLGDDISSAGKDTKDAMHGEE